MMLRNRNVNVPQQNNGGGPLKRQARNSTSKAMTIEEAAKMDADEPKAKRAALAELSQVRQVLSGVVLDSAKKSKDSAKNGAQRRGLQTVNQNAVYPKLDFEVLCTEPALAPVAAAPAEQEFDPCPEFDYDKENAHDITAVSEYARDIFRYYKFREADFKVSNYIARQPAISEGVRATLVDWLVELQEAFELNHETLYLAVKLVDIYLDRVPNVPTSRMQLIGSTAIFLGAKFDERSAPLIDDFLYMSNDSFTREEFILMEREMFRVVGYDLGAPTSYRFLRRYARVNGSDMPTLTLARYILEVSLMFLDFSRVSDSLMASAALLLAIRMKKLGGWTPWLHKYSGYEAKEVEPLMWALNHMVIRYEAHFPHLNVISTKYSHEIFYEAAYVQPLRPDPLAHSSRIAPPAELLAESKPSSSAIAAKTSRRQ